MPYVTHVLIVEDEEKIRRALVRHLSEAIGLRGLTADLVEADRAEKAFERILMNPGDAWFVVTDNNLNPSVGSVQTGLDLIQRVYENVPRIRAFRILMSGRNVDAKDFALFGVDRFMMKPCDIQTIVELLVKFLASD